MKFIFGALYIFVLCLFVIVNMKFDIHYLLISLFPVVGFFLFNAFMYFLDQSNQFKKEFSQLEINILNFCILLINIVIYTLSYAIIVS